MKKKSVLVIFSVIIGLLLVTTPAFAHSVVTPNQVGVAATQTFMLSVPTEKDGGTTTSVKLMIPTGLNFVTPVVQSGWTVQEKNGPIPSGMKAPVAADGDMATSIPTEIDWVRGSIPSGQKAILEFSAQVPAQPAELDWKVYQGYSDGSTVSWDLGPNDPQPKDSKGNLDFSSKGPYSKTTIVNDLIGTQSNSGISNSGIAQSLSQNNEPLLFSALAVLLSAVAVGISFRKGKG